MDLFAINPKTWKPTGSPIYNYESLIWTERYFTDSEFQLTTIAVDILLPKLMPGTLVGLRQSAEVMIVEEQFIETDDNGIEKLTVRGRSLTSYTQHRVVGEIRSVKYSLQKEYTNLDAGLVLIYNSLINNSSFDYTKLEDAYYKLPADAIPNAILTDSTESTNVETETRWITPGPIDPLIKDWFSEEPFGFRIIRPNSRKFDDIGKVIEVDSEGNVIRSSRSYRPELRFDVYLGTDRSRRQSVVKPVILDVEYNDLTRPNYLQSIRSLKSVAHTATDTKSLFTYNPQKSDPPHNEATGLAHRVLYLDGGEPEEGASEATFEKDVIKSASEALSKYRKYTLVDGTVSPESSSVYDVDYFLGDIVSIRGRNGVITNYRVIEFIRSKEGITEEGYPTLSYEDEKKG